MGDLPFMPCALLAYSGPMNQSFAFCLSVATTLLAGGGHVAATMLPDKRIVDLAFTMAKRRMMAL